MPSRGYFKVFFKIEILHKIKMLFLIIIRNGLKNLKLSANTDILLTFYTYLNVLLFIHIVFYFKNLIQKKLL